MSTRGQQVMRHIREGIAEARYPGGSRLNEVDLAERIGVSRTPVRNALSALAAEGLLDYTPNAGYTVRRFTVEDIARIFRVRTELEGLAARLAAENGLSPAAEAELRDLLAQTGALVRERRWDDEIRDAFLPINRRFHDTIRAAAQNPFLADLVRRANEVPLFNLIRWRWFDADLLRQSQDEHLELFDALLERQPERAYRIQAEHTYRSGRRMIDNWSRTEDEIRAGHAAGTR
ncbi:GntR family transcriptional regulator [Salipiger mangrovisoli]|uniref:GntR family transcriptional regulator n=1 Tax=Salipiger mangrovisoli TaxID=2865933 RepID=A0ABR9X369_9RHOB|nr:GntR family transcriptional regulator [Salipiger mangrovisoli]MBE9637967.1 GntR family transcriptional regulator [Salipiger mangrovisoli]